LFQFKLVVENSFVAGVSEARSSEAIDDEATSREAR
jgi:hypothetical protein